jgi:uncharacterized protein (DUF849 family)
MLLKACLNGTRQPGEHPALPLSAEDLARDAQDAIAAGAGALHVHPRDDGTETLAAHAVGAALIAIRAACPGTPVGVSTGAWILPDIARRVAIIRSWDVRPDFASVNFSEAGAVDVCAALLDLGVGVEAGIWSPGDARLLLASGLADRCVRVLIELVREQTADDALATAQAIERVLDDANIRAPRLLHGEEATAWPMLDYALPRGYDIRIGLEDTLILPDGRRARDNAQLVTAAKARARAATRE